MGTRFGILSTVLTGVFGDRGALAAVDLAAREALDGHLRSRRALALAVAAEAREAGRREAMARRAADLESRAIEAMASGREDLALRASDTIASLETEIEASTRAVAAHAAAIARLRGAVEDQRRRLADVERGRRLAALRASLGETLATGPSVAALSATETALRLIEERQDDAEAVAAELADETRPGADLVEDMAEAGFGPTLRPRRHDVLARIRAKALTLPSP